MAASAVNKRQSMFISLTAPLGNVAIECGEERASRGRHRTRKIARTGNRYDSAALAGEKGKRGKGIEVGAAPGAGVVTVVGRVHDREVVVVANDATVKAGSWWPETIKKILRAQEIAMRSHVPIIYLVDSAGVNLPYQGGVFPGHFLLEIELHDHEHGQQENDAEDQRRQRVDETRPVIHAAFTAADSCQRHRVQLNG